MHLTPEATDKRHRLGLWLAVALTGLTIALYWPATRYEFVDLDDLLYVAQNQIVQSGITWPSVRMAFTQVWQGMWAPLLWLSFMLDAELFDTGPWGFHLTNVLLHAANALLVYGLFWSWTRKPWRAFCAAALWAWHPLRIESVAWIAERKDVLSGLFFLLCVASYCRAHRGRANAAGLPTGHAGRKEAWLLASTGCLLAGLMTKPMLMTVPAVLLLLDAWPLNRIRLEGLDWLRVMPRLISEKWPFWIAAVGASVMSIRAHEQVGALQAVSWVARGVMVPLHYAFYLLKTLFPRNLTALYDQMVFTKSDFWVATLILGGATVWFWRQRREQPNGWVGWTWFLVMVLPVIGVVRFGAQTLADRFSYLPALGLAMLCLSWLRMGNRPLLKGLRAALCGILLLGLATATRHHLPAWSSSAALYQNVLRYSPAHAHARYFLATQQFQHGETKVAQTSFEQILQQSPAFEPARYGKAFALEELGDAPGALDWLRSHPPTSGFNAYAGYWEWHLGTLALGAGDPAQALRWAEESLRKLPLNDNSRIDVVLLGIAAAFETGDASQTVTWAQRWPPYAAKTQVGLEDLMPYYLKQWIRGRRIAAANYFRRLSKAYPDDVGLQNNLAWSLATESWSPIPPEEVLGMARHAVERGGGHPALLDTLAAAQANAGDYAAACQTAAQALTLLPASQDASSGLRQNIARRLDCYQQNTPWREDAFVRLLKDRYVR